jgi:D-alanine-D-alanine ligase
MDKVATKHILRELGIPTPDWVAFNSTAFRELGAADALEEIEAGLGFPLVIKPAGQGSSLGVRFAGSKEEVPEALVAAFSYDERVLLERHVDGRELAVSLVDGEALPIVEAVPREADQFNYEARYEIGRTTYTCPAELDADAAAGVARAAVATWDALGCAGFARVDVMLGANGPEVIELNAIPGLTDTSLLPMACEEADLTFERFVERALELAVRGDA